MLRFNLLEVPILNIQMGHIIVCDIDASINVHFQYLLSVNVILWVTVSSLTNSQFDIFSHDYISIVGGG